MYPAQTSFIPLTVALVKFVVEGGSVWGNYPYWYLGEVPFRYLTGPVVPVLILGFHTIFNGFSLFDWSFVLMAVAWIVAAFGWGFLAWQLSGCKKIGVLVGILSLVSPWHIVSSLALSEVSAVLASSIGPWVLVSFISSVHQLKKRSAKHNLDSDPSNSASLKPPHTTNLELTRPETWVRSVMFLNWFTSLTFVSIVLFAILLLTNTIASIPTILGLGILSFVLYKHPTEGLKKAGMVVLLGGLLTLWWYDPSYWLKILFAPSFGGKSMVGSLLYVVDMARTLLPVALAFIVVVWKVKPKNNFEKFAFLWLGSFIGLTLVRFVSNIHFWLDWTSWFGEIEVGLALVFVGFVSKNALLFGHSLGRDQRSVVGLHAVQVSQNSEITPSRTTLPRVYPEIDRRAAGTPSVLATRKVAFIAICLLVGSWFLAYANLDFWLPRRNIENTVEWQVADKLREIVKPNESVFLSGTSAFWLNAFIDVRQVRGGADQVGLRPDLAKAVWEVRMGSDGQKSVGDLKRLGVNYLVVHSNYSKEFYHDFENPGKFEGLITLKKVYDENGDIIYQINER